MHEGSITWSVSEQEGCIWKEMVNGSNEAEAVSWAEMNIAEGLVLFKALTNDLGNNK